MNMNMRSSSSRSSSSRSRSSNGDSNDSKPWSIASTIKQSPPVDMSQAYDASTLRGKSVVVTGGASGLGGQMVREWASHGAHITVGDVDDETGEALVASLRTDHPGSSFAYVHCDVSRWEDQVRLFEEATRSSPSGTVDTAVANAGIIEVEAAYAFEHPADHKGDNDDGVLAEPPSTKTIDVNVVGVVYTAHLALYHFARGPPRDRCLLLVGSVASVSPLPGHALYTMSKHAVCGLFRSLRMTVFQQQAPVVRVNMLAPNFVQQSRMFPRAPDAILMSGTAGGASAASVVEAATRLVADEAIAGRALAVGPHLKGPLEEEDKDVPVAPHEGNGKGRSVWELYAHDADEVDAVIHRHIRLMNRITQLRGMLGWLTDFWAKVFAR